MLDVLVLRDPSSPRSRTIGEALERAFCRERYRVRVSDRWDGSQVDLVAGYGWGPTVRQAALGCRNFLHVDLGYWGRKPKGLAWAGWHKVVLNARHPDVRGKEFPTDRLQRWLASREVKLLPPRRGTVRTVLVCGMSAKCAETYGFEPEQWEALALADVRSRGYTAVYRPKPSWPAARPLLDYAYSPREEPLFKALARADFVLTHHSNVTVDALSAGLPFWCTDGVARGLATPLPPHLDEAAPGCSQDDRVRLLSAVAYQQWSVEEIGQGLFWPHVREGLRT